jgi:hypothetical protein
MAGTHADPIDFTRDDDDFSLPISLLPSIPMHDGNGIIRELSDFEDEEISEDAVEDPEEVESSGEDFDDAETNPEPAEN